MHTKELKSRSQRETCTPVFMWHYSQELRWGSSPGVHQWMNGKETAICLCNRIWFSLKRKDILTHSTMWMNLENIMLSEISQSQKHKYQKKKHRCCLYFIPLTHCCCCLVAKSCSTLCNSTDCSLPGPSVHEILQARILKWVAIAFSRSYSWPRGQTQISCIGRWSFFCHWATWEAHHL